MSLKVGLKTNNALPSETNTTRNQIKYKESSNHQLKKNLGLLEL